MIYKAVEVIWIFLAGGRDGTGIEGTIRGPRGPKNGQNEGLAIWENFPKNVVFFWPLP